MITTSLSANELLLFTSLVLCLEGVKQVVRGSSVIITLSLSLLQSQGLIKTEFERFRAHPSHLLIELISHDSKRTVAVLGYPVASCPNYRSRRSCDVEQSEGLIPHFKPTASWSK